jgi:hypothetical protein
MCREQPLALLLGDFFVLVVETRLTKKARITIWWCFQYLGLDGVRNSHAFHSEFVDASIIKFYDNANHGLSSILPLPEIQHQLDRLVHPHLLQSS